MPQTQNFSCHSLYFFVRWVRWVRWVFDNPQFPPDNAAMIVRRLGPSLRQFTPTHGSWYGRALKDPYVYWVLTSSRPAAPQGEYTEKITVPNSGGMVPPDCTKLHPTTPNYTKINFKNPSARFDGSFPPVTHLTANHRARPSRKRGTGEFACFSPFLPLTQRRCNFVTM